MTPDSSRYWPKDTYSPGGPQPSFDKQYVRDYLESIKWNKQPPVPSLPDDVVRNTRAKYLDAYRRLTGRELDSASPLHKLLDQLVVGNGGARGSLRGCAARVRQAVHHEVIDKADGNLCKAADTLGVHRNTLARKIKELKIKAPLDRRLNGSPQAAEIYGRLQKWQTGRLRKCLEMCHYVQVSHRDDHTVPLNSFSFPVTQLWRLLCVSQSVGTDGLSGAVG